MSTNATITAKCNDGQFRSIYTHWDGDPEGNGVILQKHYVDQDKIEALLALGAISALAPSIECPEGHTFDTPVEGHTIAYGRDRGEEGVEVEVFDTLAEAQKRKEEYNYYWDGEKWFVNGGQLTDVLAELPA
jgi:hypothetical protein